MLLDVTLRIDQADGLQDVIPEAGDLDEMETDFKCNISSPPEAFICGSMAGRGFVTETAGSSVSGQSTMCSVHLCQMFSEQFATFSWARGAYCCRTNHHGNIWSSLTMLRQAVFVLSRQRLRSFMKVPKEASASALLLLRSVTSTP